jgi:hypothetical protein
VPIVRLLRDEAFGPEAIGAISAAFEDALGELGLTDRSDPIVELVAKRTIQFAQEGELDRHRLRELVVKSFRGP